MTSAFRLNVLNPGGHDPEQDFAQGATPDSGAHAPVNFHAYAACTGGTFLREADAAVESQHPVLLLLRGDFRETERALGLLKKARVPVVVSFKETGLHQIADQLSDPARLRRFIRIATEAEGCIAPTPEAADIFRGVRRSSAGVAFIPTPYPLHDPKWDFSRPVEERSGIFVGTREWDVPSRNHFAALAMARELSESTGAHVTVYDFDGRKGARLLRELGFAEGTLQVLTERRGYAHYMGVLAAHRIVFQLDTSFVPGQVAGDALLCRLPCIGGNGAVDRLGHPRTCGHGRSGNRMLDLAAELLNDRRAYEQAIADSQRAAAQYLSFDGIARELEKFYRSIAAK
ncbi:MAG TPA: hypothetical protein VG095_09880 [Chthoniobacterales bacterium]|nr:hypothetical protein [Chthoniobacterales bacterium]